MTSQRLGIAIGVLWALSALVLLFATAHLTTTGDRVVLALIGLVPPLALWYWWRAPNETMSETIHRIRDDSPVAGPRARD